MTHTKMSALTLALCGVPAFAATAYGACPDEAAIFLFDQSNSMNDPGAVTGGTTPKRDIALTLAKNYLAALPSDTPIAVYGLGNQPQFSSPFSNIIADFSAGYTAGPSAAAITTAFQSAHDQTITGNLWTPLAGSICQAIDDITVNLVTQTTIPFTCIVPATPGGTPPTKFQVYLMSDGGENSTPTGDQCQGTESTTAFSAAAAWTGFGLSAGSWQRKVADKAYTLDALSDGLPTGAFQIIMNISLLFSFTNSLGGSVGIDGQGPVSPDLQDTIPPAFSTFLGSFASATKGSYFESKMVNGVPTKLPLAGDTDPSPSRSCVDSADINRVLSAVGHKVSGTDTMFSLQDLISRDVNHDLIIDLRDYQVVIKNFGKCS